MRERENGFCRAFFFEKAVFPFSRGKNCISQGIENRGSLIGVPLALRVVSQQRFVSNSFASEGAPVRDLFSQGPYNTIWECLPATNRFPNFGWDPDVNNSWKQGHLRGATTTMAWEGVPSHVIIPFTTFADVHMVHA